MRLSSNAPLYIRGVSNARPTGGLVDLAMVDDLPAWRKKERERKAAVKTAAKRERKARKSAKALRETNEMLLVQAQMVYDLAPAGTEKRTALVKLRKAQERCGIFPDMPEISKPIEVAVSASGWDQDSRN